MQEQEKMPGCCRMEAVVTLDSRGQIVLPKDLRERAGLEKGDKLMVVACEDEGKVCCITLMKADNSNEMVREMLGPMLKGVFGGY
jgi:AbrB family looped-hinge helix DNA binding protein